MSLPEQLEKKDKVATPEVCLGAVRERQTELLEELKDVNAQDELLGELKDLDTEAARLGVQIFLRARTGKVITLVVSLGETVENVKQLIERQEGIPADQQRIIYKISLLEDGRTLADYGIEKEATLDFCLRC